MGITTGLADSGVNDDYYRFDLTPEEIKQRQNARAARDDARARGGLTSATDLRNDYIRSMAGAPVMPDTSSDSNFFADLAEVNTGKSFLDSYQALLNKLKSFR